VSDRSLTLIDYDYICFVKGEYTTGWTGTGASKSDKKVRIQVTKNRNYHAHLSVIIRLECVSLSTFY